MIRLRSVLPFALILLTLFSCATANEKEEDRTQMIITLPENPSTGYFWIWGQMGTGHIEMVEETFVPGENPGGMTGVPGTHVFTFKGTEPGHVTLTFSSRRNTESGDSGDTEVFSVTVYDDMTISYL